MKLAGLLVLASVCSIEGFLFWPHKYRFSYSVAHAPVTYTVSKAPAQYVVWKPVVYKVPSYTATVVQAPPPTVQAPATVVEAPKYVPEPEPVVEQEAPVYNTVPITGGGFHFTKNWSFQPYATYAVAASAGASAGAVSKTKSKEVDIDPTEEDARRRRS